jgi:hypothetical protein
MQRCVVALQLKLVRCVRCLLLHGAGVKCCALAVEGTWATCSEGKDSAIHHLMRGTVLTGMCYYTLASVKAQTV